jgi:hypothetical protein
VPKIDSRSLVRYLIQCAVIALASTIFVAWIFAQLSFGAESIAARIGGVALVGAGSMIYFIAAYLFRFRESEMLLQTAWGLLRRRG